VSTDLLKQQYEPMEKILRLIRAKLFFLEMRPKYIITLLAVSLFGPITVQELLNKCKDLKIPKKHNPFQNRSRLEYALAKLENLELIVKEGIHYHAFDLQYLKTLFGERIEKYSTELHQQIKELDSLKLEHPADKMNFSNAFFSSPAGDSMKDVDKFIIHHFCENTDGCNGISALEIPQTHFSKSHIYSHLNILERRGWLTTTKHNNITKYHIQAIEDIVTSEKNRLVHTIELLKHEQGSMSGIQVNDIYHFFGVDYPS